MAQEDEYTPQFAYLKSLGKNVRLHNIYKGIPISTDSPVVSIESGQVTLLVGKYQATCLELQRRTFIESDRFPSIVRASVVGVNLPNETATLAAFVLMTADIGKRLAVRVHPKEPIQVEISLRGRNIKGWLADLSLNGIGVVTTATFYGQSFFAPNADVTITFSFAKWTPPVKLSGTVVNSRREIDNYRLGVRLNTDAGSKAVITQYISQRQAEIQRELRLMYETLLQMSEGRG